MTTERQPLTLHVPEPAVRPGGAPDFSNVTIPKAGAVPRPNVDVDPETIRDLAFSIIRVLNRSGEAVGPGAGRLGGGRIGGHPPPARLDQSCSHPQRRGWRAMGRSPER